MLRIYILKGNIQVQSWVKELRKMLGNDICLALAGNKIDLENKRIIGMLKPVICFNILFRLNTLRVFM